MSRRAGATTYLETIACPREKTHALLTVAIVNEHGQYFEDAIAVGFNLRFADVLKWMTVVPFFATIAAVAYYEFRPRGGGSDAPPILGL